MASSDVSVDLDFLWSAHEIANLDLRGTDLVMMPHADLARALFFKDGIGSMLEAFLCAGVTTIIAPVWTAHCSVNSTLVTLFYRHWLLGEKSKQENTITHGNILPSEPTIPAASAFRLALCEFIQLHPNPVLWSGFNYFGL